MLNHKPWRAMSWKSRAYSLVAAFLLLLGTFLSFIFIWDRRPVCFTFKIRCLLMYQGKHSLPWLGYKFYNYCGPRYSCFVRNFTIFIFNNKVGDFFNIVVTLDLLLAVLIMSPLILICICLVLCCYRNQSHLFLRTNNLWFVGHCNNYDVSMRHFQCLEYL